MYTHSKEVLTKVYFAGFSQAVSIASEYATRNARKYGGLPLFSGGLYGQYLETNNYKGDFAGIPVLITTGDPGPHVPVSRVEETVEVLERLRVNCYQESISGQRGCRCSRQNNFTKQENAFAKVIATSTEILYCMS